MSQSDISGGGLSFVGITARVLGVRAPQLDGVPRVEAEPVGSGQLSALRSATNFLLG